MLSDRQLHLTAATLQAISAQSPAKKYQKMQVRTQFFSFSPGAVSHHGAEGGVHCE
jgi:hypothetical protein